MHREALPTLSSIAHTCIVLVPHDMNLLFILAEHCWVHAKGRYEPIASVEAISVGGWCWYRVLGVQPKWC